MADTETTQYSPVNITNLKAGMLLERPLYIYLSSNNRYIQLAKELHPLENKTLEKIQKIGNVFSTKTPLEEKLPHLIETAAYVKNTCEDERLASFEKNFSIQEKTEWIKDHIFHAKNLIPVFFLNRALGVPRGEILKHVEDFSYETYEQCLRYCAIAGMFALWLGYYQKDLLSLFIEVLFCETLENKPKSLQTDPRFNLLTENQTAYSYDEFFEIQILAKWYAGLHPSLDISLSQLRVTRKLSKLLKLNIDDRAELEYDQDGKATKHGEYGDSAA